MNILELEKESTTQNLYDSFNHFIMSDDKKVFNKLVARTLLYDKVKDIPGDIVECGIFKGSGFYTFLKLKKLMNPNSLKKVVGFDFFDTGSLLEGINSFDKESMSTLFKGRNFEHKDYFYSQLIEKIKNDGFTNDDFELIKGDISQTSLDYVKNNPGFKISLLYIDLDLEKPTYDTLKNLWKNVTKGGIVVFDEYGHNKWSESLGVDSFIDEMNLKLKNLNYMCPTAFIKKK